MRERSVRIAVVVVDLFAAVSAFVGAIGLVVGFMNIPLSVLRTTPFVDFTIPALLLGVVVGGSALWAAAIALVGPRRLAYFEPWSFEALASAAAGGVMVVWMTVEIIMIGLAAWVQAAYFVVGLVMIALAGLLQWVGTHQTEDRPGVSDQHHAPAA